ncbi:MAG: glycosyltransferase [Coriobacteriia bacterium]|nr:glycosyltransferase [Coriobacteriia bacterium]
MARHPGVTVQSVRLRGLTFAKQYPSAVEPLRGTFVAQQVAATADAVDWSVIAPVPWAPRSIGAALRRPQPPAREVIAGVPVSHPRYLVAPRRIGYRAVADSMGRACAAQFRGALDAGASFVHAHALYPSGAAAADLTENRVPLVLTVHGSDLRSNVADTALRDRLRRTAGSAAALIAVGPSLADDLVSLLEIPRDRIRMIPDAYDDSRFAYLPRPSHGGPVRILCVGRLEPVKGQDILIAAIALLLESGSDVELTVVGDGSLGGALRRSVDSGGLADRIRFTGALRGAALLDEYARADLYIQPSRREGFGVAIVEALATGLPVVATRSGGPEHTVGAEDGVLVDAGGADSLAAGVKLAIERLGAFDPRSIAHRAVQRYSRQTVGRQLVELYRSLS